MLCALAAVLAAPVSPAIATPTAPVTIVNHSTKQCAFIEEINGCTLPEGWTSAGDTTLVLAPGLETGDRAPALRLPLASPELGVILVHDTKTWSDLWKTGRRRPRDYRREQGSGSALL